MTKLGPLSFQIDVFFADNNWFYRVSNGNQQIVSKAPSRGYALKAGYDDLMTMIKATING